VLLTVPDAALGEVLASQALLLQLWPDAGRDVMMLLHVLRTAMPSLADALAIGLIALAGAAARSSLVLQYRRATLTVIGCRQDGTEVAAPRTHLHEITKLEVHDVAVDGRSSLRTKR
jgi:hypothetical protein